jgi:hypothetical protein
MAVVAGQKTYYSFVKGLVTEASPLLYPENSAIVVDNFLLNRTGSIQRRLGMEYEAAHVLRDSGKTAASLAASAINFNVWNNVSNKPTLRFGVVQIGSDLWFFDLFKDTLSANIKNNGLAVNTTGIGDTIATVSAINGYLIVTSKEFSPFYLEYDEATDTITKTAIAFSIRDLFGIDDGLAVNNRPSTLSQDHKYNLLNQGWELPQITSFYSAQGVYPSNSDIQYLGKDSNEDFDSSLILKQYFGNTPAPKGRTIINAFSRGLSRQQQADVFIVNLSGSEFGVDYSFDLDTQYFQSLVTSNFTSLNLDTETSRISVSASFSGRIFYSGVESLITSPDKNSPDYSGFVFFSKLISSVKDLGECYQEADPTSEHISDIIASDGGYIQIPDASNIHKLIPTDRSLIVLAENGAWEILGDVQSGFSATGYQVNRVSSIGAIGPESIIDVEGTILYWAEGGIYVLAYDQASGFMRPKNLSATTIQTYYSSISSVARQNAKASFDPETRRVSWLYNDELEYTGYTEKFNYNRELIFDTLLQAFYTNTINRIPEDVDAPMLTDFVIMPNFVTTDYAEPMVINGDPVQINTVDVTITKDVFTRGASYTKYLTVLPNSAGNLKFTFSSYRSGSFFDWYTYNTAGSNYTSELLTGFELAGDASKWKQAPYVSFHFTRTETGFESDGLGGLVATNPSGCFVSARWDFSDHANSGKIGDTFQAYKLLRNYIPVDVNDDFNYGQSVIVTKNKIRGKGKALSMQITSESGKDMNLLGWSIPFIGSTAP